VTWHGGLLHLASLPASSIKMGLERVQLALATLGHPEQPVPALHVAGTNGKGSTCAMAASALARRYRVGLYTSPHLIDVNERFKVDGADLTDEELGTSIAEVVERLGAHELTYFELATVVAFWHFAKVGVELAVMETGLGGRLDATTACRALVTCITPIGFDHMDYLGHTLTAIATEKAGIVKPGVPLVLSRQPAEAQAVFEACGAALVREGADFSLEAGTWRSKTRTVTGLRLPLRGPHQVQNTAVAVACLDELGRRGFPLTDDELREGLAATRWPGRLESFGSSPEVVLDGAHNPAGVEVLLRALDTDFANRPVQLVFGVFADKDSEPMMRALFPRCDRVFLTPIDNPRSRAPSTYADLARSLNPKTEVCSSGRAALEAAKATCPPDGLVLGAGSLFLVGQLRALLLGRAR
jgi:dihydrofolate synthase/folylpolyglutamate synthase